tara:strand:- start:4836 stop:5177 length:342 start_codon:yes stop_codon:yes gene_type:complete
MEPYLFGMITGTDENDVDPIDTLNDAWDLLDDSFTNCKNETFTRNKNSCSELKDDIANYFEKYHQYNSKLEGSNELSNQYKELNDKALMRPINISFGIMILLVLISDLTVGFG